MTQPVQGIGVSPGLVIAPVRRLVPSIREPSPERTLPDDERETAVRRLGVAMTAVYEDLLARSARASETAADVLAMTAELAADPTLAAAAAQRVQAGATPERAVWEAADAVAEQLRAAGGYIGERARDVLDVRDRIVAVLTGVPLPGVPQGVGPYVLVADDLSPADTAGLDPAVVRALVTEQGGPTSHTAILARALGLPAVVAARGALSLPDGVRVLVNGGTGTVVVDPDEGQVAVAGRAAAAPARLFSGTGRTADGRRVALLANVGDGAGAAVAARAGAQGVGLFRTEFCFLDRTDPPSRDEQVAAYRTVFEAFSGRKVVLRTLDAGADKPLPFLRQGEEPNPALGVRGLRTSWRAPDVLDEQLAAIVQAAEGSDDVWVMAPMVATAAEAEAFVGRCAERGLQHAGVMIEVPAAALCADAVLAEASFASIGTNDLAQYAMAADRTLGQLAALNDPWQPAVLQLVALTCRAAARHGRPVGVCGEAAADPALACVLAGLGVDSLSMSPAALPAVGAALESTRDAACQEAAQAAIGAPSAEAARVAARHVLGHLSDLGL